MPIPVSVPATLTTTLKLAHWQRQVPQLTECHLAHSLQ